MNREVILYTTENGECPVKDFLDSLPDKVFQKISWVLTLISEIEKIPTLYFKKLKVRMIFGNAGFNLVQIFIVYFAFLPMVL